MSTLVVFAVNGGYIESDSPIYSSARSGTTLVAITSVTAKVGQNNFYSCWEAFFDFDTSSLGASASVSAATLSILCSEDDSQTDFTLTWAVDNWGTGLTTADWVAGANLAALTTVGTIASSALTVGIYNDTTNVAFPANINKTGNTRLICYSSRHSGNNTPTQNEYILFNNYNNSQYPPRLTVTYTVGTGGSTQTSQTCA